ncbi:alcohol dehydrogenase family protein [Exiguobacterium marinum]|uniref:Alcohol dehydrogenase family protein n=1 Tax=Exiguobacterium marinum TaxID=273528 RepID=A0ABY7X3Y0_9BACL|nr:alcohol dehydrogenase family protein [Exiguobacterium marinum]WDH76803.1 alcohol dehydrogenase family protein [Exiguobacterium marinum]
MKAVQVVGYGDVDQLQVVDIQKPTPKAGEVLIKVRACAINNTEIWMREGAYGTGEKSGWRPEGVHFPRIPGSDITGEVVEVGDEVDQTMIGRHVVLFPFTSSGPERKEHLSDDMSFIGSEYDGGYAEYVAWPADLCFDMPLDDFVESAVFSVSGLTAWHMNEQLHIRSGETIVVTGASGGVGSLNVQIAANVFGAKVFAIVGDLKNEQELKALGATEVFSYRSDTLADDIIAANGGPVDAVLDVVGDALFDMSLQVLKKGGKFCISGSAGGQTTHLDFRTLYLKHIAMYGSVLGTRHEFAEMLRSIAEGKLKPVIDRTFPLEEAREAQTYFKQSGKFGKIVLIPNI